MPYCSQGRAQSLDSAVRDRALFSWFGVAKVVPAFCGYIGYEVGMPKRGGSVHVATIKTKYVGDRVYVSHLLRRSYREGGRVRHENRGNLSHLPETAISAICRVLAGETCRDTQDHARVRWKYADRSVTVEGLDSVCLEEQFVKLCTIFPRYGEKGAVAYRLDIGPTIATAWRQQSDATQTITSTSLVGPRRSVAALWSRDCFGHRFVQ